MEVQRTAISIAQPLSMNNGGAAHRQILCAMNRIVVDTFLQTNACRYILLTKHQIYYLSRLKSIKMRQLLICVLALYSFAAQASVNFNDYFFATHYYAYMRVNAVNKDHPEDPRQNWKPQFNKKNPYGLDRYIKYYGYSSNMRRH